MQSYVKYGRQIGGELAALILETLYTTRARRFAWVSIFEITKTRS